MMRHYELMYIVRPELDEEPLQQAMDGVQALLESHGGEVLKSVVWGKRRLAYDIAKVRDGQYIILEIMLEGSSIKEIERSLRINDAVLRHMIVQRDPNATLEEPESEEEAAARRLAARPVASLPGDDEDEDDDEEEDLEPVGALAAEDEEV